MKNFNIDCVLSLEQSTETTSEVFMWLPRSCSGMGSYETAEVVHSVSAVTVCFVSCAMNEHGLVIGLCKYSAFNIQDSSLVSNQKIRFNILIFDFVR